MTESVPEPRPPSIVVVDDDDEARSLLASTLDVAGYSSRSAATGAVALELIRAEKPDLIILDLILPDTSGFEIAKQLKADPAWNEIPILLITGQQADDVQVIALDSGADDFITKPIASEVLLARIRSLLRSRGVNQELAKSRDEIAARNTELKRLERAKENLMHMLVHDLKSPLGAMELGIDLLQKLQTDDRTGPGETTLQNIGACANKLHSMVQNILVVAQMEEAGVTLQTTTLSLTSLVEANLIYFKSLAGGRQQQIEVDIKDGSDEIVADMNLVSRVLDNLFSNACRMSGPSQDLSIRINRDPAGGVRVAVGDRGPGVPEELREKIFEKFMSGTEALGAHGVNQGLGLTFSKLAIEGHGGRIWVEARPGGGSLFFFHLPSEPTRPRRCTEASTLPFEALV